MMRSKFWMMAPVFAALFVSSAAAASVPSCPDIVFLVGPIAGLGGAESCGETITTGANSVDINVDPFGVIAPSFALEPWLLLNPGDLNQDLGPFGPIVAVGGAAIQFPSFTSNPGDLLQFSWTGSFEPEATGYLFYLLDGVMNVLDFQVGFANTTAFQTGLLTVPQAISEPLGPGTHSLALGVIVGFANGSLLPCMDQICLAPGDTLFDPILNVSNLTLGPAAVPEPGAVVLFSMGLLALAALRRRRS